jgi:hypothetical protein
MTITLLHSLVTCVTLNSNFMIFKFFFGHFGHSNMVTLHNIFVKFDGKFHNVMVTHLSFIYYLFFCHFMVVISST